MPTSPDIEAAFESPSRPERGPFLPLKAVERKTMRKFNLDLDAVAVQSFVTDESAAKLFGTVHAHNTHKKEGCGSDIHCSKKFADCTGPHCK
jgi:hypothetical protein